MTIDASVPVVAALEDDPEATAAVCTMASRSKDPQSTLPTEPPVVESRVPRSVGRYELRKLVGEGGMGRVYEAYDPRLDRAVAVKLLPLPYDDDGETQRKRMLREAQALARLTHPHVVEVYDVGVQGDLLYIAMELVQGPSLREWLPGDHSLERTLDVMIAAGEGLAAAHDKGIVHRDFKPANVLIGADGRVRLVDFGLARHGSERGDGGGSWGTQEISRDGDELGLLDVALTEHGKVMGTPAYMAPECDEGQMVSAAADQFSFCVTLFEALFRVRPFPARDREELRELVRRGAITVPGTPVLPAGLVEIAVRGLSVDPVARWPSMDLLLEALRRQRPRRGQWSGWLGLGGLVLGLVGVGVLAVPPESEAVPAAPVEAAVERDEGDTARSKVHEVLASSLAAIEEPLGAARFDECEQRLAQLGPLVTDTDDPGLRADLEHWRGRLAAARGDEEQARTRLTDAYFRAREAGADVVAVRTMIALGQLQGGDWLSGARNLVEWVDDPHLLAQYAAAAAEQDVRDGEPEQALALLDEIQPRVERAVGPDATEVAELLFMRGVAQGRLQRFEEGLASQRRAIAIIEAHRGPMHPDLGTALNNLGAALSRVDRPQEARDAMLRALEIREHTVGDLHSDTALIHHNLGYLLSQLEDYDGAIAHARKAIAIHRTLDAEDETIVGLMFQALGRHQRKSGRLDDAEASLREAERVLRGLDDDTELARTLRALAAVERERGRLDAARERLTEARALAAEGPAEAQLMVEEIDRELAALEPAPSEPVPPEPAPMVDGPTPDDGSAG